MGAQSMRTFCTALIFVTIVIALPTHDNIDSTCKHEFYDCNQTVHPSKCCPGLVCREVGSPMGNIECSEPLGLGGFCRSAADCPAGLICKDVGSPGGLQCEKDLSA